MPRYYFHVLDGQQLRDPSGIELPGDAAAREHASAYAKTISRVHSDHDTMVKVTNANGEEVFSVPLHPDRTHKPSAD